MGKGQESGYKMVVFQTLGYFKELDEIYINLDNDILINKCDVLAYVKNSKYYWLQIYQIFKVQ